jgi:hypothetical protein
MSMLDIFPRLVRLLGICACALTKSNRKLHLIFTVGC